MNFNECAKKYPIGFSMGKFATEKEECKPTLFWPLVEKGGVFFFIYCLAVQALYMVSFCFDTVFSYSTKDGQTFMPLMENLETDMLEPFPSDFLIDGVTFQNPNNDEELLDKVMELWETYKKTNSLLQNSILIKNEEEYEKILGKN